MTNVTELAKIEIYVFGGTEFSIVFLGRFLLSYIERNIGWNGVKNQGSDLSTFSPLLHKLGVLHQLPIWESKTNVLHRNLLPLAGVLEFFKKIHGPIILRSPALTQFQPILIRPRVHHRHGKECFLEIEVGCFVLFLSPHSATNAAAFLKWL